MKRVKFFFVLGMQSRIHLLSSDLLTYLFSLLSSENTFALLGAYPDLAPRVQWVVLYNQKYNPLTRKLRDIHNYFFPIQKKDRIKEMLNYYNKTTFDNECDYDKDVDYDLRVIPIVDSSDYKLEDYIYSITDEIYDHIRRIKYPNNK